MLLLKSLTEFSSATVYVSLIEAHEKHALRNWRNSPLGPKSAEPNSKNVTLGLEEPKKMFQSGGQSDVKPSVLSSQASLVLIYRPISGLRDERLSRLAQPENGVEWKGELLRMPHLASVANPCSRTYKFQTLNS
ncbi:hypothetical protein TNCV_2608311 [Trichonephila clavipes]|uniref:Uncharacterized protein n=1 Tax=Trichonephila clavipes TaxID=2585209 RepID=A0A8X6RYT5_TRICX|nr:hypothetical protein TNCV_2608311 [Trichonephila clavipes]